ncbi:hypothetical protein [Pedobacter sp. UBA5917]|jgi:hypothetical protein|uniref:hypothetical protein n=1 Tax=Pedobacter sp. UBA5917 TaxID=1947061 RepID=UPI0025F37ED7|nr:hypothetical protein [Pedobacter sp. UBA5917]
MGKIAHYPKQPLSGPVVLYFIRSVYIKERDLSEYFGIPSEEVKEWITENASLSETLYINKENWIDLNNVNSFFLTKYHFPSKNTLISAYMDETGFVEERYRLLTDIYFRMQKELRGNKFIMEVAKEVNLELPRLHSISLSTAIFSYLRDVPTLTNLERFFIYYKYCKDLTNSRKPFFFTNSFDVF